MAKENQIPIIDSAGPDHITLVGKTSGRELKLIKTIDDKGVVFYEAELDGRTNSDK